MAKNNKNNFNTRETNVSTKVKNDRVKTKVNDVKFDITTLRKEGKYVDSRHPLNIKFVKTLKEDFPRRDFTINAMYMDKDFHLIDYVGGEKDLEECVLRMVGNPVKRLREDPLRIIRAFRFSLTYQLTFDPKLEKALIKSIKYLELLSKDKIKMELKKFKNIDRKEIEGIFNKYSINYLLDMVE